MSEPVRVFVSHHHSPEEDAFTSRLVADLEAAGADVWVDDARITSDDFIKKINEGLTGRQWLVLVMTPHSLKSPWVQAEVNAALHQVRQGQMLGVIPIVAKPCRDADIPPLWAPLHRYDAANGYDAALNGLQVGLQLKKRTTVTPSPTRPTPPTARTPPPKSRTGFWGRLLGQRGTPPSSSVRQIVGHLVVLDAGSTHMLLRARFDIEPVTTLGRSPTNKVVVDSSLVSDAHTRITYRNRSLWVEDLGSQNGTYVNGRKITQPFAVKPDDVLQVGDMRFKFTV